MQGVANSRALLPGLHGYPQPSSFFLLESAEPIVTCNAWSIRKTNT